MNSQRTHTRKKALHYSGSHHHLIPHTVIMTPVFTWTGNLITSEDQELMERQLDLIKEENLNIPVKNLQGKVKAIHTCSHAYSQKVSEIYNFTHDDLMTEDSFILDSHSEIFVWVGQQKPKRRTPVSHGGRSSVPDKSVFQKYIFQL
uniref:Gelsolin-like domain-containing protein n=1 Tax=Salix viminalis TaxID=40686 RepID=A0A6N2L371_SALVM